MILYIINKDYFYLSKYGFMNNYIYNDLINHNIGNFFS